VMAKATKRPTRIIGNYNESEKDAPGFNVYGNRRMPRDHITKDLPVREITAGIHRQKATDIPDPKQPLLKKRS
jgi:hypothetical protein